MKRKLFVGTASGLVLCHFSAWLLVGPAASHAEEPPHQGASSTQGVRFVRDIQPILNQRCVMCHQEGSALGGLSLEPKDAFRSLVAAPSTEAPLPRVTPGSPDRSYLWHKLRGTHVEAGGNGNRMPLGGTEMPAEELRRLQAWIEEGAKRN